MGANPEVTLKACISDLNLIWAAMGIQCRLMSSGVTCALKGRGPDRLLRSGPSGTVSLYMNRGPLDGPCRNQVISAVWSTEAGRA